jgi:hypothetical protein
LKSSQNDENQLYVECRAMLWSFQYFFLALLNEYLCFGRIIVRVPKSDFINAFYLSWFFPSRIKILFDEKPPLMFILLR